MKRSSTKKIPGLNEKDRLLALTTARAWLDTIHDEKACVKFLDNLTERISRPRLKADPGLSPESAESDDDAGAQEFNDKRYFYEFLRGDLRNIDENQRYPWPTHQVAQFKAFYKRLGWIRGESYRHKAPDGSIPEQLTDAIQDMVTMANGLVVDDDMCEAHWSALLSSKRLCWQNSIVTYDGYSGNCDVGSPIPQLHCDETTAAAVMN